MKKIPLKRQNLRNPLIDAYSKAVRKGYSSHHVLPSSNGWAVKRVGVSRSSRIFRTQKEAIRYGRSIVKNQGQDLIIHNKNGRVRR